MNPPLLYQHVLVECETFDHVFRVVGTSKNILNTDGALVIETRMAGGSTRSLYPLTYVGDTHALAELLSKYAENIRTIDALGKRLAETNEVHSHTREYAAHMAAEVHHHRVITYTHHNKQVAELRQKIKTYKRVVRTLEKKLHNQKQKATNESP